MKNHLLRLFVSVIGLYGATAITVGPDLVDSGEAVQDSPQRGRAGVGQADGRGQGRHLPTVATAPRRQPWPRLWPRA